MSRAPIRNLFDALSNGDERALEKLVPPIRERLLRLAKQRLVMEHEAEEVVQETLATLWAKRTSVQDRDHVLPFLFQILRNKIGSAYLRADRERTRQADEAELDRFRADPAVSHPGELFEARELEAIVVKAIETCAAENKLLGRVLQLLHEGRSHAEIQVELGDIPSSTVRSRMHRARQRLREILKEEYRVDLRSSGGA